MAKHVNVFLLTVAAGRRLFYSEVVEPLDDPPGDARPPGPLGWLEEKFHGIKDRWRHSRGHAVEFSRRVWDWLHTWSHPDEALYARLRSARSLDLRHPSGMAVEAVKVEWSGFLARGRLRHWPWLIVNVFLAPLSIVLAPIPGPNVLGYWFLYRAIHHLFILNGLGRVRAGEVAVRFLPRQELDGMSRDAERGGPLERLVALGCDPAEVREFLARQRVSSAPPPPGPEGGHEP